MPRTRKTQSGAPAQPVSPIAGQMYGAGVEQMQMQKAMPAPQLQQAAPTPTPAAAAPAGAAAPMPSRAQRYEQALAAAAQLKGQAGILGEPTARPNEPVTAGLPVGPGPGPEVLTMPRGNPTGNLMRRLAAATGDSYLRELADRAGL